MSPLPPPGTFRLYAHAAVPLPAGRYVVTGRVTGLPGEVEQLNAAIDVTAPRFTMPPDQILSTFPPASARGSFTTRLPQIVLRRRTIPWERSKSVAVGTVPRPWLALVLLAGNEGNLIPDVPVAASVTPGVALPDPTDIDTPKTTCLEVPQSVIDTVFPAREDLALLTHVREVDLQDTELAIGDDDGWMAVVLSNRLPQMNTKYTACLINIEGQENTLPTNPPVESSFNPGAVVFDLTRIADAAALVQHSRDAVGMGLVGEPLDGVASATTLAGSSKKSAALTGSGWNSTTLAGEAASPAPSSVTSQSLGNVATEIGAHVPFELIERTYRFPVLASWSFTCTEAGDFQRLANQVTSRLLGHVQVGPESPDGGEPAAPPATPATEEPGTRPLPLVTETGHIATAHQSRRGDTSIAWFRGPLIPEPTDRPAAREDGGLPLAHHADQLRRVTPDGLEDLTYAAAFEIGRLLALSRPSVVAALNRWRQEKFAAATTAVVAQQVLDRMPERLRDVFLRADPIVDAGRVTHPDLPGPQVGPDELTVTGAGRRFARGILSLLSENTGDLAEQVDAAPPGFPLDDDAILTRARSGRIAGGLGLPDDIDLDADLATVTEALWTARVPVAERNADADLVAARAQLENLAGALGEAAVELSRNAQDGPIFRRRGPG